MDFKNSEDRKQNGMAEGGSVKTKSREAATPLCVCVCVCTALCLHLILAKKPGSDTAFCLEVFSFQRVFVSLSFFF